MSPDRMAVTTKPTTDTKLEIPVALYKEFSKAAVTNGRTMEQEIITRLSADPGIDDVTEKNQ